MAEDKYGQPNDAPDEAQGTGESGATAGGAQSPEEALEAARAAAEQYKDQALRALAESENMRRRFQREREDTQRYAVADFAKEILPVVDNLRRALDAIPAEARVSDKFLETLASGVELTERQLLAAFERFKLAKIDPQPGERFDATKHQAMFEVPDSGHPSGAVVQVVQPGYMLHDRLLRPALVGVAKAGAPAHDSARGNGHDPALRVDTVA
jgi:molecular chaperone GrpE